jgi:outer membrane murein-binding lipoprotein Lpp
MTIGTKEFENQPKTEISMQQALNAAWAKVGQMTFQIDIMTQQLQAFEQENNRLKAELEELKGKKPTKKG